MKEKPVPSWEIDHHVPRCYSATLSLYPRTADQQCRSVISAFADIRSIPIGPMVALPGGLIPTKRPIAFGANAEDSKPEMLRTID